MSAEVGDTIDGRYELRRVISGGARCVVFEAQHVLTKRPVALKLLRKAATDDAKSDVLAEARLLTELRHPCIVNVLDAATARMGLPYYVMEMLEGRSLAGVLAARGKLDVKQTVMVAMALCRALAGIHRCGVVHYDLQPANVFLPPERDAREWDSPDANAKLIGFGMASRAITAPGDNPSGDSPHDEDRPYMAPEQLSGEIVDQRCDIYSLGVVVYQCLTGELPRETGGDLPAPHELQPKLPKRLSKAVMRAITKSPDDRYEDGRAFANALWRNRTASSPPPASVTKKRKVPRASYITPVRVTREDESVFDGTSEDISKGGMLLIATQQLEATEKVVVRFALPMSGQIVTVIAMARWAKSARGGKGAIGLEFTELPADAGETIGKYVAFFGQAEKP